MGHIIEYRKLYIVLKTFFQRYIFFFKAGSTNNKKVGNISKNSSFASYVKNGIIYKIIIGYSQQVLHKKDSYQNTNTIT